MINQQLMNPRSIVVVGGSNDVTKPGGKILKNLIDGNYRGQLHVLNLKEPRVQGIPCHADPRDLPDVDLAIMAIAARHIPATAEVLAKEKNTRAFIVLSAGFSEESEEGAALEKRLTDIVNSVDGALIGPNCIGILTPHHHSVFTLPIPRLDAAGCDFISGSGATACFIMEAGIPKGLSFAHVFSVGNSAQMGVEEVLQYLDETFDPRHSSRVKLLYIEHIAKPGLLLKHAASLIRKGCRIAAVKAGSSEAGSRAASSHTGALASPDAAVDGLFRKAGIVRCHGREDLISVASVFRHPPLQGKRLAVITHAGGPAVMLTDALSEEGMAVPPLDPDTTAPLLARLFPGSSVANPIDFLATGTAEQLGDIIDHVEQKQNGIDGMVVIFGTPGLTPVFEVYEVLDEKMRSCRKPIFPVLPSILTARKEVEAFIARGRINFPDEVMLGRALGRVFHTPLPVPPQPVLPQVDHARIRAIVEGAPHDYLPPQQVQDLLDAAGIPRVPEGVFTDAEGALAFAREMDRPVAMKVVGPVHKSDVGGVQLDLSDEESIRRAFERMMQIPDATAVLLQPMLAGRELFVGAKREEGFGHMLLCGLGGIFIEVFKDVSGGLSPLSEAEALDMIRRLKSYPLFEGVRGQAGISKQAFVQVMLRLSALVEAAPEIAELDLNPLMGEAERITAVDARIRIGT